MNTRPSKGGWRLDDPISTILLVLLLVAVFLVPWKSCGSDSAAKPASPEAEAPSE